MPRLHGFVEVRFVQPFIDADGRQNWRHPNGYKFTIITDQVSEEAYAERLDGIVRRAEQIVQIDHELGHEHELGCRMKLDPITGTHSFKEDAEWRCERHLRLSRECVRTAERTMLVRIEIPP